MGVKPLTVAFVASVLLVVVIGADATMNRYYTLDVQAPSATGSGTTWRTIAQVPPRYEDSPRYFEPTFGGEIPANRSDTITFRLRAENGYFWAIGETFRVYQNAEEVTSGTIRAPARSESSVEFTLTADSLLGTRPVGADAKTPHIATGSLQVDVDGESLFGYVTLREVSAS